MLACVWLSLSVCAHVCACVCVCMYVYMTMWSVHGYEKLYFEKDFSVIIYRNFLFNFMLEVIDEIPHLH